VKNNNGGFRAAFLYRHFVENKTGSARMFYSAGFALPLLPY